MPAVMTVFLDVKIAKFLLAIRNKKSTGSTYQIDEVNGQIGIITYVNNHLHSIMIFDFTDERIQSFFIVINPNKPKQLA